MCAVAAATCQSHRVPVTLLLIALMYAAVAHGAFHAGELAVVVVLIAVALASAFVATPPDRRDLGAPTLAAAALAAWYVIAALAAGHPAGAGPAVGLLFAGAATIAITDPASSGVTSTYFLDVLKRLGIADKIEPKLRLTKDLSNSELVARGEAEMAVELAHEIRSVAGVEFVPFPPDFQRGIVFVGRELRRSAKHQVFEQMSEAALAGLDLISRTCSHHDKQRDDIWVIGGNRDQTEAVGQILLNVRIRENLSSGEDRTHGQEAQCQ